MPVLNIFVVKSIKIEQIFRKNDNSETEREKTLGRKFD